MCFPISADNKPMDLDVTCSQNLEAQQQACIDGILGDYRRYYQESVFKSNLTTAKLAVLSCLHFSPDGIEELLNQIPKEIEKEIRNFTALASAEQFLLKSDSYKPWRSHSLDSRTTCANIFLLAPFDKDVCTIALKKDSKAFVYADSSLHSDPDIVALALQFDSLSFGEIAPDLRDSEKILKCAVQKDVSAFRHASCRLRDDKNIAELVIQKDPSAFAYVSDRLKDDLEFAGLAIQLLPQNLQHAGPQVRDNDEILWQVIRKSRSVFEHASDRLRDDLQ